MAQEITVLAAWQEKTSSYRLTSILVPCRLYTHPYMHRHILYYNSKNLVHLFGFCLFETVSHCIASSTGTRILRDFTQ